MGKDEYDLVVIGGGVTGAGIALDAVTRGLKVALIEKYDFSSGTSSKSTKLIHGGVRYLEKAFWNLDYGQYQLVREALAERNILLKNTPHFSHPLPILLPIHKWYKVPYFWAGGKAYDALAGFKGLTASYYVTAKRASELFPVLNPKSTQMGAIVYHDGQTDDSRLVISLILTAASYGAKVANYVSAESFIKTDGVISGVVAKDVITGETFEIKGKGVISATGPFTDELRRKDEPETSNLVVPSAGVHIVLPGYYSPENMGLLEPETSDGRIIFFLPWKGVTIAGTTDTPSDVLQEPVPLETDIHFILKELDNYVSPDVKIRRADVLSAWSGIRPLVMDPDASNTESLSRTHIISNTESKLLFVSGGKLTTYRRMAEETIDKAVEFFKLSPEKSHSVTERLPLIGSRGWNHRYSVGLIHKYGFTEDVAEHLSSTYGTRSDLVSEISFANNAAETILHLPILKGEILYSVDYEFAQRAMDFIARRTRIAFLNSRDANELLPYVIQVMGDRLNWNDERRKEEMDLGIGYLKTMGFENSLHLQDFSEMELMMLRETFYNSDNSHFGYIMETDITESFRRVGVIIPQGFTYNEYLQSDRVSFDNFLAIAKKVKEDDNLTLINIPENPHSLPHLRRKIDVDRSGGGL